MSVLLTLALPVAAHCADAPKASDKADAPVETVAPKTTDKTDSSVDAIKDSVAKSKHSMMGGTAPAAGPADLNPAGKVVETKDGGGYSYARLQKDGKMTWVAYPTMETRVGDVFAFKDCVEMTNFESKALSRKFDSILFCGKPEVKSKAVRKSPGSVGSVASAGKIKVEKASGANAYTVAEIFAKAGTLNGKQVVVKGQVVKSASGIMDRTWIHLQDGSGSEKKKNHDLVVTSQQKAEIGDVVTVSGTLAKDKDFGSGYKYNVIIEKGILKK
jgi:hypothetical protein